MISIYYEWYGRNEDMTPNYDEKHHGNIHGETPADCMAQFRAFRETQNLVKETIAEIVMVY